MRSGRAPTPTGPACPVNGHGEHDLHEDSRRRGVDAGRRFGLIAGTTTSFHGRVAHLYVRLTHSSFRVLPGSREGGFRLPFKCLSEIEGGPHHAVHNRQKAFMRRGEVPNLKGANRSLHLRFEPLNALRRLLVPSGIVRIG